MPRSPTWYNPLPEGSVMVHGLITLQLGSFTRPVLARVGGPLLQVRSVPPVSTSLVPTGRRPGTRITRERTEGLSPGRRTLLTARPVASTLLLPLSLAWDGSEVLRRLQTSFKGKPRPRTPLLYPKESNPETLLPSTPRRSVLPGRGRTCRGRHPPRKTV